MTAAIDHIDHFQRRCSIADCGRKHYAKGLCAKHYLNKWKTGTPVRTRPTMTERFWAKVDQSGGVDACWPWMAALDHNGYGRFSPTRGTMRGAHRVAYELIVGDIPEGLVLDHLCRNRACVNPRHLEPVTQQENVLRGVNPRAITARTGVCVNGHVIAGDNAYEPPSGGRHCATCRHARDLARKGKPRKSRKGAKG